MEPCDGEPPSKRSVRQMRRNALRRARHPAAHVCGPDCFVCLVAAYARTVTIHPMLYQPERPHGAKPRATRRDD
jgi:hypothetical protein